MLHLWHDGQDRRQLPLDCSYLVLCRDLLHLLADSFNIHILLLYVKIDEKNCLVKKCVVLVVSETYTVESPFVLVDLKLFFNDCGSYLSNSTRNLSNFNFIGYHVCKTFGNIIAVIYLTIGHVNLVYYGHSINYNNFPGITAKFFFYALVVFGRLKISKFCCKCRFILRIIHRTVWRKQ